MADRWTGPSSGDGPPALAAAVAKWLKSPRDLKVAWVIGREGQIYVRHNVYMNRIDLANFDIDARHQGKGIAYSVIAYCCGLPIKTVRIENILNKRWASKVREYRFEGRDTVVTDTWDGEVVTVDFVRSGS